MEIALGIFVLILLLITGYLEDNNIFLLLNIIEYSLIVELVISVFLYIVHMLNINTSLLPYNRSWFPYGYLLLFNIIQILVWYLIERKYDRFKDEEFYKTITYRTNFKGLIVQIPIILHVLFFVAMIIGIIEFIKINIL